MGYRVDDYWEVIAMDGVPTFCNEKKFYEQIVTYIHVCMRTG